MKRESQQFRCHAFHQTCIRTYCETVNVGVAEMRCPVCKLSSTDINHEVVDESECRDETPRVPTPAPASWLVASSDPADAADGEDHAAVGETMAPTLAHETAAPASGSADSHSSGLASSSTEGCTCICVFCIAFFAIGRLCRLMV